jgi:Ca2+-binding RTX toxin-like protein
VVGRKALLTSSVVLGVVFVALASTPIAAASTASMNGDDLTYAAAAGETNHAHIFRSLGDLWVVDTGATITAGAGCTAVDPHEVKCSVPAPLPFCCLSITVTAGDLNDFVAIASVGTHLVNTSVSGEAGNDEVNVSAEGNNILDGGAGNDTLKGGAGECHLIGGAGADVLSGEERAFNSIQGASVIADYSARVNPVTADDDGNADDGEAGEGDNVIAVDEIHGGSAADTLTGFRVRGSGGNDTLTHDATAVPPLAQEFQSVAFGGPGADTLTWSGDLTEGKLEGGPGNDTLTAGPEMLRGFGNYFLFAGRGNDTVIGGPRSDRVDGGRGDDTLRGNGGPDNLTGRLGDDRVFGGHGRDLIRGNLGDDTLFARDGQRDKVRGATGHDRARIDRKLDDVGGVEVFF